jgi:hypothetical protein
MPLLLFSIGVIAPISTVQTLTWLACGIVLLTGCFVMLTSGPVTQREAPSRRGPARSRRR